MLKITNENSNQVLEAAIKAYKKSDYNDMCFSLTEMRTHEYAGDELNIICGVDHKVVFIDKETIIDTKFLDAKEINDECIDNYSRIENFRNEISRYKEILGSLA